MRKCPSCGMDNGPSANFCRGCGAQLPAETPAKKKKPWMKAVLPVLVLILGAAVYKGIGGIGHLRSCPTCNEILDLQKELQAVMAENEDNSLTLRAFEQWDIKVSSLSNEIQVLKDHECNMPVRKVKNQEYAYGRYAGTYTGEWKSTAPCGEGVFSGSYRVGDTQYVLSYSGTWTVGAPNGAGALLEYRGYLGAAAGQENWVSRLYEGSFVDGKLTGSGWYTMESSTGDRYEYYDGVYRDGFLEGQANFVQYRDGELYDMGVAEGLHCVTIYSTRQEVINTIETVVGAAGLVLITGIAAKGLYEIIRESINGIDPNSEFGKKLEARRIEAANKLEKYYADKEKEQEEKARYDKKQDLLQQAYWCETSPYADVRKDADSWYAEAAKLG